MKKFYESPEAEINMFTIDIYTDNGTSGLGNGDTEEVFDPNEL